MSESNEIKNAKIDSLVIGFTNSGYKSSNRIGQTELLQFLNKRSSSGKFDEIISEKLFQVLNLDTMSTISVEDFINGYLQFEEDIRKNAEYFNIKLTKEQEIYLKLAEECKKYKEEKLNSEGLCENAKVYGEITEIDIKRKLEGIKEIIIKIIYNEESEELHFKIGDINNSSEMANKKFEFKPKSRKDHFEFIMKGINDRNQIFDIGSKVFPLTEINSCEEYLIQIVIPEIENEEQIAAYINAKIVLYWSDYKYYEKQRKKAESKLKKLKIATNKATEYLKKIREIYGDLTRKKPDLIVDFNNEKLMQRKGVKLNVDFNNVKEAETTANFVVEFNNQKEVQIKKEINELKVEFNNIKEIEKEPEPEPEPIIEKHEEIIENNNIDVNIQPETTDLNNIDIGYTETNNEYQEYDTTQQVNYEEYGTTNNINYDEYQTGSYEQTENIELQNTEIVKETEIRNSVQEALIRQSINKALYSQNTLPVKILEEKVNAVIVDSNVKTLPLIYGGKKVTYANYDESADYNNLIQQNNTEITQDYTQGQTTFGTIQGENYIQSYQGQDYATINQNQDYTQGIQVQDFTQGQNIGFGFEEYKTTSY